MVYTKVVNDDVIDIIDSVGKENMQEKLKDKTFLITGASGMIGSYFVYTLLKLNELFNTNIKVLAMVRDKSKLESFVLEDPNVDVIVGDVTDPILLDYSNIDYVVHAASPASPKIMREYPVETNFANTIGTANTLKLALEKHAEGYLFVSSREIYGEPILGQEIFEENGELGQVDPLVPRNGYAEGKKAAENMCVSFKEEYNLNTKIVRLAHTYGPGMSIYDGRVQADFLKNVLFDEDIVLKSDGSSIRTYTYIADAIVAMFLVLLNSNDLVYNIADENSKTSIKELAETLVSIYPEKGLKLIFDIPSESDKGAASFKMGILSTEKIRNELNWNPKYSIEEGFKRTLIHLHEQLEKEHQKILRK